jgi:hypothetical protein
MSSRSLLLEYKEMEKKGFIVKEVKEIRHGNSHIAHVALSSAFIGQKIRISLEKE